MKRMRHLLFVCLSVSCAVSGFSIDDTLPGGSGGDADEGGADARAGDAGKPSSAGTGATGAASQGGKPGSAGDLSTGGTQTGEAGAPSDHQGGIDAGGAGGADGAPSAFAPCDESSGQPPLLCDDFESGSLSTGKWTAANGVGVSSDVGPRGATKLMHLTGPALETKLSSFPLSAAGSQVTVSFWVKTKTTQPPEVPLISFRARTAQASALRVGRVQNELGLRSSASNFFVPQSPTQAVFQSGVWTCLSIQLTNRSMLLRYQAQGSSAVNTLTIDDVATPNVDETWHNLSADARNVDGFPSFAGPVNGVASDLYLDDVRITADTSSVCPF